MTNDAGEPTTIQCLVNQSRSYGPSGLVGGASTLWLPGGISSGGDPGWDPGNQAPRFWVLDRATPLQQPLSFVASDYTTVPPGLQQALDHNHILVAAVLAYNYRVPQGPLYDLLMANGAGTALTAVENVNTFLACGVQAMFSYVLVSVAAPDEGEEGLEFLELPAPLTDFLPSADIPDYQGTSFALFDLVLDPDDGRYFPAPSISPLSIG